MEEQLMNLKNEALSLILDAKDVKTLEEVKLQFLGRSGKLTLALKNIVNVPQEKRAEIGKLINEVKESVENAIDGQLSLVKKEKLQQKKATLDVTNPGIRPPQGHLHLVTQAIAEISSIFEKIGFTRVRYPEVEWDWYAFTALNFPENHPARDDWETFFTTEDIDNEKGSIILTPHTSNGQIREMESIVASQEKGKDISIRMLNISKTYRRQSDVSHTQMFHQFEGLVVGRDISIVHLKGVLDYFVKSYFGEKREARIRPYHFQFTEPSFEIDVTCGVCLGKARLPDGQVCKLCKAGWLEMGGAGMVHPNVLKFGGVDSKEYTGFAFGWGVERVAMMKEGIQIDDLRLMYSNKLEFLEQF